VLRAGDCEQQEQTTNGKLMMLAEAVMEGLRGNIGVGLVGMGAAIGVGMAAAKAAEATGRNPGAFGKVFTTALIGMALAEGLAILTFFVVAK
jgi:F-type H+-transporting ATPase subunit c